MNSKKIAIKKTNNDIGCFNDENMHKNKLNQAPPKKFDKVKCKA